MATELMDLVIEEISLVGEPANPAAQIKLFKRKAKTEANMEIADDNVVKNDIEAEVTKNLADEAEAALAMPLPNDLEEDAEDLEKGLVLKKIAELEKTVAAYRRKEHLQEVVAYVKDRWHKVPDGAVYLYEKCWGDPQAMTALQNIANLNNKRYSKMVAAPIGTDRSAASGNPVLDALESKIAEKMASGATRKAAIATLTPEDRAAFFAALN